MQQYFVEGNLQCLDEVKLKPDQAHHVQHVLRMKDGDIIRIANLDELVFQAHLRMEGKHVYAILDEPLEIHQSPIHITLAQALIKGEKWDYLIQKVCELGVHTIQPILMNRCVVKVKDEKSDRKKERWNKIALEACEQCKRSSIVRVEDVLPLTKLELDGYDVKLLAYENADHVAMNLKHVLSNFTTAKRVLCIVGPEGGFEDHEVQYLLEQGFTCISLGPRILRAETAAMALVHALTFTFDC